MVTAPAAPPVDIDAQTAPSTHTPSTGAKAGIGIGVAISVLLVAFLIFGIPYLRSRQRTRALQRAVDEVERGTEMHKATSHVSMTIGESKENMVLESRVEIVVADDESDRDVVAAWDGWDATWEEGDDMERGRKGMSLPRRAY
jgi:low affinity Fe/Cu permease